VVYLLWAVEQPRAMEQPAANVAQVAPSSGAPQPDDGEFSLGQIVVQAQVDLTVALK